MLSQNQIHADLHKAHLTHLFLLMNPMMFVLMDLHVIFHEIVNV